LYVYNTHLIMLKQYALVTLSIVFLMACRIPNHPADNKAEYQNNSDETFDNYWYAGVAEINSYELEQPRYGEMREGEAVLIFVTEDFLTKNQVKREHETNDKYTSALKLNFNRKFTTGIYDYSMMTSVFSAVNQSRNNFPIKISNSVQEWCGQSFTQLNQTKGHYHLRTFSYFENEGDVNRLLPLNNTEDGIWLQIRIAEDQIPEGEVEMIPGIQYQRLSHVALRPYKAIIKKSSEKIDSSGEAITSLSITYPELERTLSIFYLQEFPHKIVGWEEQRQSNGKQVTTKANLKKTILEPYWDQKSLKDSVLRKELMLQH